MNRAEVTWAACLILIVAGCEMFKTVPSTVNCPSQDLTGTWKQACRAKDSAYTIETLSFSGTNFTFSGTSHTDAACVTAATATKTYTGTTLVGKEVANVSCARELDILFSAVTVAPTGAASNQDPSAGETFYTIYRVDGTNFYMGEDGSSNQGGSAANRSSALNSSPYVKQ